MRIGIILYGCTEDVYRALYTLSELEMEQSIHEQLRAAQRRRIRREKAFKKARALGLTCISGGKSQKGAVNG